MAVPSRLTSPALHRAATRVEDDLASGAPDVARMFRQCLLNTMDSTVSTLPDGTTFVITGDIPAMWLRDSAAQVEPYIRFAADDESVRTMIRGVIRRQAMYIGIDPYANAFNEGPNGNGHQGDLTAMSPWVWERKWELDSLCYPIRLCKRYWDATADRSVFDDTVHQALRIAVATMRAEQRHEASPYSFVRPDAEAASDTLPFEGRGTPSRYTGMVWSGFRPSDDACAYGYLIPANMFAVVVLGHVEEFAEHIYGDAALAEQAASLRAEIDRGIQAHARLEHPVHGTIYAYETDGLGHHNLMDDANVPSLLSIPYLGYRPATDPVYRNTRAFVLSPDNPHYAVGRRASGVGSPHTPPGQVWPMSLIMQGLTATDTAEQWDVLATLADTTAGTGYMHESFDPDDPSRFTRPWFGWANSLFAELVMKVALS
ncbi:glycoside hydrolase family 125 protein [Nonomuraea guangzhouensis]|uniref:Glycoside hydrolase family 125 protein n=1 Tax=Nonomuraea guangzhouensis TaxID=1291555 RepID=A0ABW4GNK9_9ACTN|nr:glycoside hydrolase family 125 protein [Nonomuraea guangzhouensis]